MIGSKGSTEQGRLRVDRNRDRKRRTHFQSTVGIILVVCQQLSMGEERHMSVITPLVPRNLAEKDGQFAYLEDIRLAPSPQLPPSC